MPLSIATRMDRLFKLDDIVYHRRGGDEYWYRSRQVLVHWEDYQAIRGRFPAEFEAAREEDLREREKGARLAVVRCWMRPDVDVPQLVRRARAVDEGPEPRISPNHVFGAAPNSSFGPGDVAIATNEQLDALGPLEKTDGRFTVGVLDTGVQLSHNPLQAEHQPLCLDPATDEDPVDVEPADGMLDDADVHGVFVADIVRRHAPEARVVVCKVLLGTVGDELAIADGIATLAQGVSEQDSVPVLNLSLYGYTEQNLPPMLIVDALRALPRRPVVVAAAGNLASTRPAWPAALKRVIGVAAVDDTGGAGPVPADFTNRGPWVDACAHGVKVLGPFVTFDEHDDLGEVHGPFGPENPGPQSFSGHALWSGTSFAAPKVAGRIVARAMQIGGDPYDAAHQAAHEQLRSGQEVGDLGIHVP